MSKFFILFLTISSVFLFSLNMFSQDDSNSLKAPDFNLKESQLKNMPLAEAKNIIYESINKYAKDTEKFFLKKYSVPTEDTPFNWQRFETVIKEKIYNSNSLNEINLNKLALDVTKRLTDTYQPLSMYKIFNKAISENNKVFLKAIDEIKASQAAANLEFKNNITSINKSSSSQNQLELNEKTNQILNLIRNPLGLLGIIILITQIVTTVIILNKH